MFIIFASLHLYLTTKLFLNIARNCWICWVKSIVISWEHVSSLHACQCLACLELSINSREELNILHLSMPSWYKLQYIPCDVPARLLHWAIAQLTVPVLCMCLYFWCVLFCGLKSQPHSDHMTVMCMQLLWVLYVYSLRLAPQCHAFL